MIYVDSFKYHTNASVVASVKDPSTQIEYGVTARVVFTVVVTKDEPIYINSTIDSVWFGNSEVLMSFLTNNFLEQVDAGIKKHLENTKQEYIDMALQDVKDCKKQYQEIEFAV